MSEQEVAMMLFASQEGNIHLLSTLIQQGINVNQDLVGATAVTIACQNGQHTCLDLLIQAGSQVNARDDEESGPLISAAKGGHYSCITRLIAAGAQVNQVDPKGFSALMGASALGYEDCVACLIAAGSEVNLQDTVICFTALHMSCVGGHLRCIQHLIQAGANVNACDFTNKVPLMEASENGHPECVSSLIQAGAEVNRRATSGMTAFLYASSNGHKECMTALLDAGASICDQDNDGNEALTLAALNGHVDCVHFLLHLGTEANRKNSDGVTAVMNAASNGHDDVIKTLIDTGALVDEQDKCGTAALMKAARNGHDETLKILIKAGAEVNKENNEGDSALFEAIRLGHNDCLQTLIESGAEVDKPNSSGNTPLMVACSANHMDCVLTLLKAVVSVKTTYTDDFTPLVMAASHGHDGILRYLLQYGAVEGADTALVMASNNGNLKCVRLLVQQKDFEAASSNAEMSLHMAVQNGHWQCVVLLLQAGVRLHKDAVAYLSSQTDQDLQHGSPLINSLLNKDVALAETLLPTVKQEINDRVFDDRGYLYCALRQENRSTDEVESTKKLVRLLLKHEYFDLQKAENRSLCKTDVCLALEECDNMELVEWVVRILHRYNIDQCYDEDHRSEMKIRRKESVVYSFDTENVAPGGETATHEKVVKNEATPFLPEHIGCVDADIEWIDGDDEDREQGASECQDTSISSQKSVSQDQIENQENTSIMENVNNPEFARKDDPSERLNIEEVNKTDEKVVHKTILETEKDIHKYMRKHFESRWKTRIATCTRNLMGVNNTSVAIIKGLDEPSCSCSCFNSIRDLWAKVKKMRFVLFFRFFILLSFLYYFDFLTDLMAAYTISSTPNVSSPVVVVSWVVAWVPHLLLSFVLFRQRKRILFVHMNNWTKTHVVCKYPYYIWMLIHNLKEKLLHLVLFLFQLWPMYMYFVLGRIVWDIRGFLEWPVARQSLRTAAAKIKQELVVVSEINTVVESSAQLFLSLCVLSENGEEFGWLFILKIVMTPISVGMALLQLEEQLEYPVELGIFGSLVFFVSAVLRYVARFSALFLFVKCFKIMVLCPIAANVFLVIIIRCIEVRFMDKGLSLTDKIRKVIWTRKPWMSVFSYQPDTPYDHRMPRGCRFFFVVGLVFIDFAITLSVLLSPSSPGSYTWWLLTLVWCCHPLSIVSYVVYLKFLHPWKYCIQLF